MGQKSWGEGSHERQGFLDVAVLGQTGREVWTRPLCSGSTHIQCLSPCRALLQEAVGVLICVRLHFRVRVRVCVTFGSLGVVT